jgi:hypothetical protein
MLRKGHDITAVVDMTIDQSSTFLGTAPSPIHRRHPHGSYRAASSDRRGDCGCETVRFGSSDQSFMTPLGKLPPMTRP